MEKKSSYIYKKVMYVLLPFYLFTFLPLPANAQTFLNHLQQKKQGEGKITVTQSKAIDDLVNGRKPTAAVKRDTVATTTAPHPSETKPVTEPARPVTDSSTPADNTDVESPTVDLRKKVMRKSYKVDGYRVQAFAGGNTRADKQKAEQTGRDIKMKYPDLPVYVHFYSPQWKCRVGNFRSYEEASRLLKSIKAMGYSQACIVKGKISVQY